MDIPEIKGRKVQQSEHIHFKCQRCAECCKHVYEVIPAEALDIFRMTKHLQKTDSTIKSYEDVVDRYLDPVPIDGSGFCVLMLKSVGEDDRCIFLEGNRCTIQSAKPRACRTYPLAIGPEKERLEYFLCTERTHHYKGPQFKVRNWVRQTMNDEDKEFVIADPEYSVRIARVLRKIPRQMLNRALLLFLHYRYSDYDLEQPFMPQYRRKNEQLLAVLQRMIGGNSNEKEYL